ncbi:MAG: hypothetical protein CVV33_02270 [Methanomicrobiales archaeon HGW-Methanomicrobiales-4]|nr:MAG: hypothetical protein CVV33_02270 [Methanomicrobiales archaeon HGW-Methanomicrobiales-4]
MYFMVRLLSLLLFIILIFFLIIPGPTYSDPEDKTLIAIYMVGSDLESLDESATTDIDEMLTGISGNSSTLDIVIAYGGARKIGWEGMTIATLEDLRSDYLDGTIGNGNEYQVYKEGINMGSSNGLSTFLQYINGMGEYQRKILIFWDHGGSYDGVCFDENYDMDSLDLKELRSSLQSAQIHWDLIGMDACLMGSYEVARVVEGITDYLLVSEEVEPGHGWNYTMPFQVILDQPGISIPAWGKVLIDDYLDNPYHEPHKKTLALIDINKIQGIEEALSRVSRYLNATITDQKTYNGVGTSISESERYGYDPQLNQERTIDLSDLTIHLDATIIEGSPYFSALRSAIADAVIYQRNDGSRPDSWGVSIFSPRTKPLSDFTRVSESVEINKGWNEFMRQYMTFISQDNSKPIITDLGGGQYRVTDDQGLAYVRIDTDWMPDITNWSHSFGLKSEPVYPIEPGLYIPNPDDQTFYLKDTGSGKMVPFFHSFIGTDSEGNENYFGYIQVNRSGRIKDAVINPIRNPESGEITYSLYPYDIKSDGQQIFSKVPITLKPDDIITPKIVERFLDSKNPRWQYSFYTPLTITDTIEIVRERLPYGSYTSTLSTSDYNSNFAMVIIGYLRFPNNSSVTIKTAP